MMTALSFFILVFIIAIVSCDANDTPIASVNSICLAQSMPIDRYAKTKTMSQNSMRNSSSMPIDMNFKPKRILQNSIVTIATILKKFHQFYPQCPPDITSRALDLKPQSPIWHPRISSHPSGLQPHVLLAVVFNQNLIQSTSIGPTYKIAMPMYYAERYIRQSLKALLELTTGELYCIVARSHEWQ